MSHSFRPDSGQWSGHGGKYEKRAFDDTRDSICKEIDGVIRTSHHLSHRFSAGAC